MAISVRKKSSIIFSPPSYIKKGKLESKVEKIINDTIREKIFNLLDINNMVYIKYIEYFPIFFICKETGEKSIKSIMMRIKKRQNKFKEIETKEIQYSGINIEEFTGFLENNGSKKIFNYGEQLENL